MWNYSIRVIAIGNQQIMKIIASIGLSFFILLTSGYAQAESKEALYGWCISELSYASSCYAKETDSFSSYEGEWRDGMWHGQGTFVFLEGHRLEGQRYEGEWHNGKRHEGTMIFTDGDRYEGEYRDGKMSQGAMIFANGARYEGEWRDGKQHGQGTYVWPNGNKWSGEWRDGKRIID